MIHHYGFIVNCFIYFLMNTSSCNCHLWHKSNLNEVNHEYLSGVFISVFHPEYWKRFECIFISVDKIKTTVNATIKLKMFLLNKLFLTTLKLFGMVIFYYKLILYLYIELENEQDNLSINIYIFGFLDN